MARYYTINDIPLLFKDVYHERYPKDKTSTEESRGLTEKCPDDGDQHAWLLLPHEEGQKHYLVCLKCFQVSHL